MKTADLTLNYYGTAKTNTDLKKGYVGFFVGDFSLKFNIKFPENNILKQIVQDALNIELQVLERWETHILIGVPAGSLTKKKAKKILLETLQQKIHDLRLTYIAAGQKNLEDENRYWLHNIFRTKLPLLPKNSIDSIFKNIFNEKAQLSIESINNQNIIIKVTKGIFSDKKKKMLFLKKLNKLC